MMLIWRNEWLVWLDSSNNFYFAICTLLLLNRHLSHNLSGLNTDPEMKDRSFFLNAFTEFSNKKYLLLKGLKPATSCVRDQDANAAPARYIYMGDMIFKLNPIHASVIYQIPWIHWIQWKFWSI